MDTIWYFVGIAFILYIVYAILKDIWTKAREDCDNAMRKSSIQKSLDEADRAIQEYYQWELEETIITRTESNNMQIYYDKEEWCDAENSPNSLLIFWAKRPNAKVEIDEIIAYVFYEGYQLSIKAPQQGRLIRAKGDRLEVNDKEIICEIEPISK